VNHDLLLPSVLSRRTKSNPVLLGARFLILLDLQILNPTISQAQLVLERQQFWKGWHLELFQRRFPRYIVYLKSRNKNLDHESHCEQSLLNKRVLSIDLAGLLAGTGIRGQFEEKFKALLKDIEEEGGGIICFIDELRQSIVKLFHSALLEPLFVF
jgi:hypothetical protein